MHRFSCTQIRSSQPSHEKAHQQGCARGNRQRLIGISPDVLVGVSCLHNDASFHTGINLFEPFLRRDKSGAERINRLVRLFGGGICNHGLRLDDQRLQLPKKLLRSENLFCCGHRKWDFVRPGFPAPPGPGAIRVATRLFESS